MRANKIVAVGWNYRSHLGETDAQMPTEPIVFLKPTSAIITDGEAIRIPPGVGRVDHEVELAVIIGKDASRVTVEDALSHVSHLAVANDVTARDIQNKARKTGNPWALSKGMDTFAPLSEPVPLDSVDDIQDLRLELKVNGELRQRGRTSLMIFPVAELIAYISRFMTLEAGDVIMTGTPEGIGPLLPGDEVVAKIDGVGTLRNPVV